MLTKEEIAEMERKGVTLKRKSLEDVYVEHMDTQPPEEDYEIVRGPRPWEEHPQKEQILNNKKVTTVKIDATYGL